MTDRRKYIHHNARYWLHELEMALEDVCRQAAPKDSVLECVIADAQRTLTEYQRDAGAVKDTAMVSIG